MKIALVISSLGKGGAERVLSVLANYFCEQHDVCVIKFDAEEPFYKISPKVRVLNLDLGVGERGILGNFTKRFNKIFALRKILKRREFDVVISFWTTPTCLR